MLLGVTLIFFIAILAGCTSSSLDDKKKFLGNWRLEGNESNMVNYTFLESGTFFFTEYPNYPGTWDLKNGELTTNFSGVVSSSYYSFSNNDRTLTLTDLIDPETKLVLTKQTD